MNFEKIAERPSQEDLEAKAIWLFDNNSDNQKALDAVIRDLKNTAADTNMETNTDSLINLYPGYQSEDFSNLANLVEKRKGEN